MTEEARCPECRRWSPTVSFEYAAQVDGDPVHAWATWWSADTPGCPQCGAVVLVESECEYRHAIHVTGEDDLAVLCWKTLALEDAGHAVVWLHEGREYRRTGGHDAPRQD